METRAGDKDHHAADSTPNQSVDQNGLQEADYDPGNDDDFGDDNSDYA